MKQNICSMEKVNNCTGCGMCSAVCPKDAIKILEDKDGFYQPVVDQDKCIECSLCTKVCYKFDSDFSIKSDEDYECYSAVNKEETELKTASSGAVSIELMRECLHQGYYVVGVAYDNECNRAITKIAKTEQELEQFKGSKYFQSFTQDTYKEILSDKSEQKYAIFGTPCQIYAFSKMAELKGNRDKYILVDIFCHGCPSLKTWDKYLEYIKEKSGLDSFDKINFRSKTHGWHEYCIDFIKNSNKYSSSKFYDPFFELFFSKDVMNKACYDCIARSSVEKTDIRMGDFWGKRYNENTKGVSAVVISTSKGKNLFDAVASKFYVEQADFNEILSAQSYKKIHQYNIERRTKILNMLSEDNTIDVVVKKRRKTLSLKTNIKRILKSLLKHLPDSIYLKLKNKLG